VYYTAYLSTPVASHSPIETKLSFPRAPQPSGEEFLLSLGGRVRDLRNRRGMTRKTLAHESDVSERHLAQLESGEGNISVLLLRRIAAVLNVSLEELFAPDLQEDQQNRQQDGQEHSSQKQTILRFIDRLPTHRLEEATARLMRDFGPEQNLRLSRIALIGLRGAGKSTLGSKLAAERNLPFIELDHEIEKDTGMPLAEIFSLYGQSGYRAIEKRTLERVLAASDSAVISVGGGIVSEKETYDYLLAHCYTIWLKAQPEEHMSRVIAQGDFRAMAGSDRAMEDLRRILESREPLYRKADTYIDTSGDSVDASFTKLKAALQAAAQ
jgi:XRE family transcriptional regulator, aerobic/anaerobic benzoate catabolism transcriptional regulator